MSEFLDKCPGKVQRLVEKVRKTIQGTAFENKVYIVGGAVRDVYLDSVKEDMDVDMVVEAPDGGIGFATWLTYNLGCHVVNKNPCVFPTYGTAKFQITNDPDLKDLEIECVQTRKEKYNKETRNPATAFGSIEEDAMRRDLTINALYYNISTDEVCDFTKRGLSDIKNHIIRTTGDANMVFDDDPLRILRVIRFATRLGWPIEKKTWFGMVMKSNRIAILTQERVTDEVNKILVGRNPSEAIVRMDRCNILNKIFPSLDMSKHVFQDLRPKRTLYDHILDVLDKTPNTLETRLAAIFHDIGKLKTYDKNFMFHSVVGAEMTEQVMRAMKYPNAVTNTVKKAVECHEEFSSYMSSSIPRPAVIRKFVVKFDGNEHDLNVALDLIHANNICQTFGKKAKLVPGIRKKIEELDKKQESGKKLTIPVNGQDVMKYLDIKPGPFLGTLMNKIKAQVIENPDMSKEELLEYAKEYMEKVV